MLIGAYRGSIAAAVGSPSSGEAWSDGTFWTDGTGWLDGSAALALLLEAAQERASPGDPATPFFGKRRSQPVLQHGPATSSPPRRGVPAETAARS